jgi:MFS family permease
MKTETAGRKERLWSRDFILIMITCSGISFCNYFFVSTLPILAQNMTGTKVWAGLMTTVFTLSALATRPVSGILSERFGRVRLLVIGAALVAAACFLYRFSSVIILLILVRALQGVGFGIHTTAGGAVPADIVPKSRLNEGLGIYGIYGTIATALAPGIALSIVGPGDLKSFMPLFVLSTVIALVCLVLDTQIRYERGHRKQAKAAETAAETAQADVPHDDTPLPETYLGFEAGVLLPAAVMILAFIAFSSVTSFLTLFAAERGLGNIGLFFTVSAAGMFLSRIFLGRVADRRGADIIVIPSLSAVVLCVALIPLVRTSVILYILGFPLGLAQGAFCPALNTMMFQRCSAKRRGAAAAAYFSCIDIGMAAGALVFGFVADEFGFSVVYWSAAAFAAAAAAIYLLFLRGKRDKANVTV